MKEIKFIIFNHMLPSIKIKARGRFEVLTYRIDPNIETWKNELIDYQKKIDKR